MYISVWNSQCLWPRFSMRCGRCKYATYLVISAALQLEDTCSSYDIAKTETFNPFSSPNSPIYRCIPIVQSLPTIRTAEGFTYAINTHGSPDKAAKTLRTLQEVGMPVGQFF